MGLGGSHGFETPSYFPTGCRGAVRWKGRNQHALGAHCIDRQEKRYKRRDTWTEYGILMRERVCCAVVMSSLVWTQVMCDIVIDEDIIRVNTIAFRDLLALLF